MKAKDIINQLFAVLPIYTNYFTDDVGITQITSSGTTAAVTTTTPHGLASDDYAHISGALTPNPITTLTSANEIASATTANDHDLTQDFPPQATIEIIGADQAEYNGTKILLTVPNRKNFTYEITGTPTSPATGSPKLLENLIYGYNGWKEVTVIDPSTFEYTIPKAQGSPAMGNPICRIKPRISGSATIERALAAYTKQNTNKLYAFIVTGNKIANKDRQMTNDAIFAPGKGVEFRQLIIQPFSVYVFIPAIQTIAARQAKDLAEDLITPLCKSLLRFKPSSPFVNNPYSAVVFSGSNFYQYNNAFYVQEFVFEITEYITYEDTIDDSIGVAFRDIDIDYLSIFSDNVIMTDSIDLDNDAE